MTAQQLTPGAQFNVYRNALGTDFSRAVLHELISYAGKLEASQDTAGSMAEFTRGGSNDLMALDSYAQRNALIHTAEQAGILFDRLTLAYVAANDTYPMLFRTSSMFGADITRTVTNLFPDLTCNHGVVMALESVITYLFATQGQDKASAHMQAAIVHGMAMFTEANATRRAQLPANVPVAAAIF